MATATQESAKLLLTPEEVADILEMKTSGVIRLVNQGKLKAMKIARRWRFRRSDIEAFVEKQFE